MNKQITPPQQQQQSDTQHGTPKGRIHDIDALRGIVLLGILLVHTTGLFGFDQDHPPYEFSKLGLTLTREISQWLSGRCAPVFGMLFGVSFYLILKNPDYPARKFAWRCILLMGIGLFNKIFYTYDALMWYGIWGLVLLTIRNLPTRLILCISISSLIASCFLQQFHFGDMLFHPKTRYVDGYTLNDILTYPLSDAICGYLKVVFNSGIFGGFAVISFGYWCAKKQLMYSIKSWATWKTVLTLIIAYFVTYKGSWYLHIPMLTKFGNILGAISMATLFLYIYTLLNRRIKLLEAYGRMGLTNYSFQGIIGVCSLTLFLFPNRVDFPYILLYFIGIYIFQCLFSYYWLKYFKFGPMEYLWRSLTNRRFSSPLIQAN